MSKGKTGFAGRERDAGEVLYTPPVLLPRGCAAIVFAGGRIVDVAWQKDRRSLLASIRGEFPHARPDAGNPAGFRDLLSRYAGGDFPAPEEIRSLPFAWERVSSFDRTGGNKDSLTLKPGETAVLADLQGPGAVHHIWVTIAAEAFYGRKLGLRIYWDGEAAPSVEAPIGDFFGVGHGLDRNFASLPLVCASEGRARNADWYMPFQSCRITATNEGTNRGHYCAQQI